MKVRIYVKALKLIGLYAILTIQLFAISCKPSKSITKTTTNFIHSIDATKIAQNDQSNIWHICPPNWWADFNNNTFQILIHGKDVAQCNVQIASPKVSLINTQRLSNTNYLFVDLQVNTSAAHNVEIILNNAQLDTTYSIQYTLKNKADKPQLPSLSPADVIYLIMPDRFANADTTNDILPNMLQNEIHRDSMFQRHGGDLQGISQHIPYLKDLGITAIWLNPVNENNQPLESYHGYAATKSYTVDARLGGNAAYRNFIDVCHNNGIKVVKDIIHNHFGDKHWLMQDLPDSSWVHQWDKFTRTTYRAPTMLDPHAAEVDKALFIKGWFDHHMPDLNQDNKLLANFLIQNNLWWIEEFGIDAFRLDTYAYSQPQFLEEWSQRIAEEYPHFFSFGETWVHGIPVQAYFHGQTNLIKDFNPKLPALTDFQLYYALNDAITKSAQWTEGVNKLYYTLAKDYVYQHPAQNVIFLDNHDLSRFYSMVNEDIDLYKMGISLLLTTRGIPSLYYGTEILLKNYADPDGKVRQDFPGGWPNDTINKFEATGRTAKENEAFNFVKNLLHFRQNSKAITQGRLIQFVPEKGVYAYARVHQSSQEKVIVFINPSAESVNLALNRFNEVLLNATQATEITNSKPKRTIQLPQTITIQPKETIIWSIK